MKKIFYTILNNITIKRSWVYIIFTLCIFFNFFSSKSLMAQKIKKGDAALAVGAAIAAAIAIEEYKEQLESDAVDYILMNHPELSEFRIKCLLKKGEKLSDNSGSSAIIFQLTTLNKSIKNQERKVLIRFNNDRFMNENGLKIDKVEYVIFEPHEWNSILAFFGNLVGVGDSIIKTDKNFNVPMYKKSKCDNENAISARYYNLVGEESERCYEKDSYFFPISNLVLKKNAFFYPTGGYQIKEYPFYKLQGDDYIVGDFSNSFKIFANENSIGIFIKSINKSILLKRTIVRNIHSFINFHDLIYKIDIDY